MSWGKKIALLYIGFVVMIAALIFRSAQENNDLDSADYYQRELQFQDQINGAVAVNSSGEKPTVDVLPLHVVVKIPAALGVKPEGDVLFYRPDDAGKDKRFGLSGAETQYDISNFVQGTYTVRMSWKSEGVDYYYETKIYIP